MKVEFKTTCTAETEKTGAALAKSLKPGTVVAMYGQLGAGKTAFVRGMAKGLGCLGRVTSPTFTIVNEYAGDIPLFHFDMYRLRDVDELYNIGWDDYLNRDGVCVVEWSENVLEAFDGAEIRVHIDKLSDNERKISIEVPEK